MNNVMNAKTLPVCLVLVAALLSGCQTDRHGYVSPIGLHPVKDPANANFSDFKMAVEYLVQSLQDDEDFRESYNEFLSSDDYLETGHTRPILMVGGFTNNTDSRVTQELEASRTLVGSRLRRAKLFKIVDDLSSAESVSGAIERALVDNAEGGLKKGESLKYFGRQLDADYYLLGVYRELGSEGRYTYLLELGLWNLATGLKEWSDTAEIDKE